MAVWKDIIHSLSQAGLKTTPLHCLSYSASGIYHKDTLNIKHAVKEYYRNFKIDIFVDFIDV